MFRQRHRNIQAPGGSRGPNGRTDFTTSPYFGFVGGPADGAYATVADLARFADRLCAGRVLLPAFTRLVTTGKVALSPDESPPEPSRVRAYGYGWRTSIVGTHTVFGFASLATITHEFFKPFAVTFDFVGMRLSITN